jgi:hypothetical protein
MFKDMFKKGKDGVIKSKKTGELRFKPGYGEVAGKAALTKDVWPSDVMGGKSHEETVFDDRGDCRARSRLGRRPGIEVRSR